MDRRHFLGASLATLSLPLSAQPADAPAVTLGVSLAGAEFGAERPGFSNEDPGRFGREYTYNSERTFAYFADQGFKLPRLPIRWERIQPRLGGELDAAELGRLKEAVGWAAKAGGRVVIDIHNYGRYCLLIDGKKRECVIDEEVGGKKPVTREHLADLWRRLAEAFKEAKGVAGYGLMNEPHHMGRSDWKAISQEAVNAIRSVKDTTPVYVAGDDWSSAERWVKANGPKPWVDDPAGKIVYEAHCYFDHDASGKYARPFDREKKDDPKLEQRGANRVRPFLDWCRENNAAGFVGEFGVPGDEDGWKGVLAPFLEALAAAKVPACWWAGGEWWGKYRLSLQPGDDFRRPAPQLGWLRG